MKSPGVRAKKTGARLKRGAALQVMCYPRWRTKAVIVKAARIANTSVSGFMTGASLNAAAQLFGCAISDLVPPEELQQYGKFRVDPKRSAAAKRAWATRRMRNQLQLGLREKQTVQNNGHSADMQKDLLDAVWRQTDDYARKTV